MLTDPQLRFLTCILGEDGSVALKKAAERSTELNDILLPRTIWAWLNTLPAGYQGSLPGSEGVAVNFAKSENGYTGSVDIGEARYNFEDASLFHVTASVALALGVPNVGVSQLRDRSLEKVGRSIDVLAKSRSLNEFLRKRRMMELEKVDEQAGPAAKPKEPIAPEAPRASQPEMAQTKAKTPRMKVAKPAAPKAVATTVKLSRSEASHPCSVCGQPQFRGESFRGCSCLADLAKSAKVIAFEPEGVIVELPKADWDPEAVATLYETVGRE